MTNVVSGAFHQWGGDTEFPMPLALWKTTITLTDTSGSFEPQNEVSGAVVACWIDPSTLTAAATIKAYMQTDDLSTPEYLIDYTVPDPAVESRVIRDHFMLVFGKLQVDVASATAGDSFDLYVWVHPDAALEQPAGSYASVAITRPADTSAYTAGDVIGTATGSTAGQQFDIGQTAWADGGGEYMITSASLMVALAAVPSGMTSFRLHLYNVTPPSALGDNAAWDLPSGDRASYLGYVDLGTPVDLGSTLYVQQDFLNKQVTLLSGEVFGYLRTIGAYTPASQTIYTVKLHAVRL